jgi:hypothetical protein
MLGHLDLRRHLLALMCQVRTLFAQYAAPLAVGLQGDVFVQRPNAQR